MPRAPSLFLLNSPWYVDFVNQGAGGALALTMSLPLGLVDFHVPAGPPERTTPLGPRLQVRSGGNPHDEWWYVVSSSREIEGLFCSLGVKVAATIWRLPSEKINSPATRVSSIRPEHCNTPVCLWSTLYIDDDIRRKFCGRKSRLPESRDGNEILKMSHLGCGLCLQCMKSSVEGFPTVQSF